LAEATSLTTSCYDLSLYGGVDSTGQVKQLWGQEAVGNSVLVWLGLGKGEVLRQASKGGILSKHLTKPMSNDRAGKIKEDIFYALQDFRPELNNITIDVVGNYEKRYWTINVKAWSPEIKEIITVSSSVKNLV
jgi:hypothetical protein